MLIIRGVTCSVADRGDPARGNGKLSPHYVLEVRRDGHLDESTMRVETAPDMPAG